MDFWITDGRMQNEGLIETPVKVTGCQSFIIGGVAWLWE